MNTFSDKDIIESWQLNARHWLLTIRVENSKAGYWSQIKMIRFKYPLLGWLKLISVLWLSVLSPDAFAVFERVTDCFSVDRYREIRCMINNNLHIGPHLGFAVNRDTILAVRRKLSAQDIETLLDLHNDQDGRIVIAARMLLVELGEDAYRQLIDRLKQTDPLLKPDFRQELVNTLHYFNNTRPDLAQIRKDISFIPSVKTPPNRLEHAGQQQAKPYSPDSRGLLKIDENAFDISTATGGLYYFWAPGEFGSAPGAVFLQGRSLTYQFGTGEETEPKPGSPVTIPVNANTHKLSLFVGAQKIEHVRLLTPSGLAVENLKEKAEIHQLKYMYIVHIRNPEPGRWNLEFSTKGKYIISASGR